MSCTPKATHFVKAQTIYNQNLASASNHDNIPLVCRCGNHDVGNSQTKASMKRFTAAFGDDFLAFWVHGTCNIVINTALFADPTGAMDLYQQQLVWLEDRLQYAQRNDAANIFVFGHHPWFLYKEDEKKEDLQGLSPYPMEWNMQGGAGGFPDSYFHIPIQYRARVMDLFRLYQVDAAFSGHFHQNLVSKTSFGMDVIMTSSLSMVFESTGKPKDFEPSVRGIRVVECEVEETGRGRFSHRFELLEESN